MTERPAKYSKSFVALWVIAVVGVVAGFLLPEPAGFLAWGLGGLAAITALAVDGLAHELRG